MVKMSPNNYSLSVLRSNKGLANMGLNLLIGTLPKTNIAPKNNGFQEESPFPGVYFQGAMLISGRVYHLPMIFHQESSQRVLRLSFLGREVNLIGPELHLHPED